MVISMVDVGEQTGALPEMLMKIADNFDEEVDNAVAAMTSLLEPIMIVFLAVVVGSIVHRDVPAVDRLDGERWRRPEQTGREQGLARSLRGALAWAKQVQQVLFMPVAAESLLVCFKPQRARVADI